MSSLLIAAALSCRFRSGMLRTTQSPILVRHKRSTSECLELSSGNVHEKVAKAILRTLAPENSGFHHYPAENKKTKFTYLHGRLAYIYSTVSEKEV